MLRIAGVLLSLLAISECVPVSLINYQQPFGQPVSTVYTQPSTVYTQPLQTVYASPATVAAAATPLAATTTTQNDSPLTIPTTFQTSLPTLLTMPPTHHFNRILQTFLPAIRPVTPATTPTQADGTYSASGSTLLYVQPQQPAQDTQGTATGQQVLYYYAYPTQQQQTQTSVQPAQPQQQLASRSPPLTQPTGFSYYIHPSTYIQPQTQA